MGDKQMEFIEADLSSANVIQSYSENCKLYYETEMEDYILTFGNGFLEFGALDDGDALVTASFLLKHLKGNFVIKNKLGIDL